MSYEQDSGLRIRDWKRWRPGDMGWQPKGNLELTGADEEGQAAYGPDQGRGDGQD